MWRELDLWMYGWIAPGTESNALIPVATWLAQWSSLILLCIALQILMVGSQRITRTALCLVSAVVAQTLAHALANHWDTPRPFMLGLSPNHLAHGLRGGLPSAHASVMFALGGALWMTGTRGWRAWLVATPILLTTWARVYAGAHFPLDILAGAALGILVAWACIRLVRIFTAPPAPIETMALTATGDKP